ncbi:uncharacterized protein BJX67DRAFT_331817 [Aspergillus lucknowensis]|uniref:SnoaL-like domain-containing protein n=1 Tax=Aspergillus lucknowensis TaxID=176173 RepID=A0ABR4LYH7_9EURO
MLKQVSLPLDFLYPLDADNKPKAAALHWPHLKALVLEGDPIFENNSVDRFDPITRRCRYRCNIAVDVLHELYISMAHAVHNMPALAMIRHTTCGLVQMSFDLSVDQDSGQFSISWDATDGYKPDRRVAMAWGFDFDTLRSEDGRWTVELPNWRLGRGRGASVE